MLNNYLETHKSRIVGLDIIRALAIIRVVYGHGAYLLPEEAKSTYMKFMFRMDGVSIFFVLSGFLIGGILLRTVNHSEFGRRELLNFWVRRWFRTVPNYILVLIALLVFDLLSIGNTGAFSWKFLLFAQNIYSAHPAFFGEAWSLCVEEWFYLTFPLLCFAMIRLSVDRKKAILYSALLFIVAPVIIRSLRMDQITPEQFDANVRKVVICRLDSLMYGIIGAYLYATRRDWWQRVRYWALGIGLAAFVLIPWGVQRWPESIVPFYYSVESLVVLLFLPFCSQLRTTGFRWTDALFIFVSIISYSMYLLNLTPVQKKIIPLIDRLTGWSALPKSESAWIHYPLYWFLVIFGSWLLYTCFEKHMTNLRDKLSIGKDKHKTLK